jgi:hypothetical protein
MRACWLKWVGRDWSISADYIWLNYSGANNVSQATYTGSNLQHWKLSKHKNGFTVQLAEANEYLNVRLAMARDGANVQTWSNGGTIETLFMFEMR